MDGVWVPSGMIEQLRLSFGFCQAVLGIGGSGFFGKSEFEAPQEILCGYSIGFLAPALRASLELSPACDRATKHMQWVGKQMSPEKLSNRSAFHIRYRWVGLPLFFFGLVLLGMALLSVPQHGFLKVLLSMAGTGLGLASFGVNHDTGVAYAVQVQSMSRTDLLSDSAREELEEDMRIARAETLSLRPARMAGIIVPWVSLSLQTYVAFAFFG